MTNPQIKEESVLLIIDKHDQSNLKGKLILEKSLGEVYQARLLEKKEAIREGDLLIRPDKLALLPPPKPKEEPPSSKKPSQEPPELVKLEEEPAPLATRVLGKRIPLNLDEPSGFERKSYLVNGGIPFPKGELVSLDNFRILNPRAEEVPCQPKTLAYWPDKSIKWLLLRFPADISAKRGTTYKLEYGERVTQRRFNSSLKVERIGEDISVNTGPLRFLVKKEGSGFLDKVWLDGKVIVDQSSSFERRSFLDILKADNTEVKSKLRITHLEVEEKGPLEAIILIRGEYFSSPSPYPFTLRIQAYANQSYLKVFHSFTYTGKPEEEFIKSSGFSLPLNLSKNNQEKSFAFGFEDEEAISEPIQRTPEWPTWNHIWLLQDGSFHYKIRKRTTLHNVPLLVKEGMKARWVNFSDKNWGLTVTVRNLWEQYPKCYYIDAKANILTVHLWPPYYEPLDLRRYDDTLREAIGESLPDEPTATGIGKTHEMLFYFHQGGFREAESEEVATFFDEPSILYVNPTWYAETKVLGYYHPYDRKRFPQVEDALTRRIEFWLYHQKKHYWYGMIDYGDFQSVYKSVPYHLPGQEFWGWLYDAGRWAWINEESMPSRWLILQYLRTGERRYFLAAEAMVRHIQDIDMIHWHPNPFYLGKGSRHNVNHWGDGYKTWRVPVPFGSSTYYYLTGHRRTYDTIVEYKEAIFLKGGAEFNTLYAMLVMWEITGQDRYRELATDMVNYMVENQFPDGPLADSSGYDVRSKTFPHKVRKIDYGMFFYSFAWYPALEMYYDLTEDKDLGKALIRLAEAHLGGLGESWVSHIAYYQIMALSYRISGDKKYLNRIKADLEATDFGGFKSSVPLPEDRSTWTEKNLLPGKYSRYSLWPDKIIPYALYVLASEENSEKKSGFERR